MIIISWHSKELQKISELERLGSASNDVWTVIYAASPQLCALVSALLGDVHSGP